jgi:hypothetical protein
VVEGIPDPVKESNRRKEVILLAEAIQLRIPVEHARRNKLVENTNDERGQDGKDDIVVGHCPAFKRNLAGKAVEPRVLRGVSLARRLVKQAAHPEQAQGECDVFVERVWA